MNQFTPCDHPRTSCAGFTLAETMMSLAMVGVLAGIGYTTLNSSMMLYGKNMVLNLSQQTERYALNRVLQAVRVAVSSSSSAPQLIDASRNPVAGNGPAAGIRLYAVAGNSSSESPMLITANAASTATSISVQTSNGFLPQVGDRLVIPALGIERDISAVSGSAPAAAVTLAAALGKSVDVSLGSVVVLFCRATDYVVVPAGANSELRCFTSGNRRIVGNVTTPTPFSRSADGWFVNISFATKYDCYSRQGTTQQMLVSASASCRTSLPPSQ